MHKPEVSELIRKFSFDVDLYALIRKRYIKKETPSLWFPCSSQHASLWFIMKLFRWPFERHKAFWKKRPLNLADSWFKNCWHRRTPKSWYLKVINDEWPQIWLDFHPFGPSTLDLTRPDSMAVFFQKALWRSKGHRKSLILNHSDAC